MHPASTTAKALATAAFFHQAVIACILALMFSLSTVKNSIAQPKPAAIDMDKLVTDAKREGQLTYYLTATENVARRTSDAFKKEYGIDAQFVRLTSAALKQRFGAEAQASNIAADLLIDTGAGSEQFVAEGLSKNWLQPVEDANLPILRSGGFPKQFVRGAAVIVQVSPWLIAYNTTKFKPGQAPKSWADLTDQALKGQILFTSFANASPSYMDMLELLLKQYGPDYMSRIRNLEPRWYNGGVPAMNALAAGEGAVMFPAVGSMVAGLKDKGAPIDLYQPDFTTGVEQILLLAAPDKSKRPNAARLFANWIMGRDGNKIVNADPGNVSVYDTANLPRAYQAPGTRENRERILRLLDSK